MSRHKTLLHTQDAGGLSYIRCSPFHLLEGKVTLVIMVTDWSFSIFRRGGGVVVQPLRYFLLLWGHSIFQGASTTQRTPEKGEHHHILRIYIYSIERERKKKILKWKGNNSVRPPASSSAFDAEQSRKEPFVAGVEGSFLLRGSHHITPISGNHHRLLLLLYVFLWTQICLVVGDFFSSSSLEFYLWNSQFFS